MSWAWIAIGLGALIILIRLPLVVRPAETLQAYEWVFFGTDARVRVLGAVYVGIAAACFLAGAGASRGLAAFLQGVAVLCLAMALWTLLAPAAFRRTMRSFLDAFEREPPLARAMGVVAVLIGVLLVYLGVQSL